MINIIAGIISGLVVVVILNVFFKKNLWEWVKEKIILSVTDKNIALTGSYDLLLKKMEKYISESDSRSELKVLCFMGKDLTIERGLLDDIKIFLTNGGRTKFLIQNPQCKYVTERARELNKDENTLRTEIRNSIICINEEFKKWYPTQVEVKLNNQPPLRLRMNFISDVLFLGFYSNVKSYKNIFHKIPNDSALYNVLEKLHNKAWKDGKSVS